MLTAEKYVRTPLPQTTTSSPPASRPHPWQHATPAVHRREPAQSVRFHLSASKLEKAKRCAAHIHNQPPPPASTHRSLNPLQQTTGGCLLRIRVGIPHSSASRAHRPHAKDSAPWSAPDISQPAVAV